MAVFFCFYLTAISLALPLLPLEGIKSRTINLKFMDQLIAEFIGTFLLILFGCGVVANTILDSTKGNNGGWVVITLGWGIAVFIGVVVAGPVSGAHINPAVTLGLAVSGAFPWSNVLGFILAQTLGAIAGAATVWVVYKDHFDRTESAVTKLGVFSTIPQIKRPINNFLSEVIGTFTLVFVILYIAGPTIHTNSGEEMLVGLGSLGALPVALLVVGIGMSLGGTTGYAINPARDLGPRIAHTLLPIKGKGSSDWSYAWVPIVGPILGAATAAGLYLLLKGIFTI